MTKLDTLAALAGNWSGTYDLWVRITEEMEHYQSPTTAAITPMLGGKFVRVDYTWTVDGEPQEGSILCGYEARAEAATAAWIDSWHNNDTIMVCRGTALSNGGIDVVGSYPGYTGPDWGWRTILEPGDGGTFRMIMYNISPEGIEELAVEAVYTRAT